MAEQAPALVGAWELVAWQLIGPDGAVDAFGPHPRGLLIYTADGHMSVVISAPGRAHLAADPAARTAAEKAAAFDGTHAYTGTYSLRPGEIVHHVQVATLPNYEGTDQRRRLALAGDRLTLTTPPGAAAHLAPGSAVAGCLTWQRRARS